MPLLFYSSASPSDFDDEIADLEQRLDNNPNDLDAADRILRVLDYYTPARDGLGAYSDCQREIFAGYRESGWTDDLLDVDRAAEHYHRWNGVLASRDLHPQPVVPQLFAGDILKIHGDETNCAMRMALFNNRRVISRLCVDCYKVQVLPEDVTGLIQTYFLFRDMELPRDNTRKCMIELRPDVQNPYKGYIYCESEEEALRCRDAFEDALQSAGISNIHCGISHGCSEFGLKYPEFKYSTDGAHRSFQRPDNWDRQEDQFFMGREFPKLKRDHYNKTGITIHDVLGFRAWIRYAEMIGDDSCSKFLGGPDFAMPEYFTQRIREQADKRRSQLEALRQKPSSKA